MENYTFWFENYTFWLHCSGTEIKDIWILLYCMGDRASKVFILTLWVYSSIHLKDEMAFWGYTSMGHLGGQSQFDWPEAGKLACFMYRGETGQ